MTELTLAADSRLVQSPNLMVSPLGTGLALMGAGGRERRLFRTEWFRAVDLGIIAVAQNTRRTGRGLVGNLRHR